MEKGRRFLGLAMSLGVALSSFISNGAEKDVINEGFEVVSEGAYKGSKFELEDGHGVLTCASTTKHSGGLLLFETPFKFPKAESEFLSFSMEIIGMKELSGNEFESSARIFISPEPLPKFIEPYVLENALWVYLVKNNKDEYTFSLFQKIDQKEPGMGKLLYEAKLEGGSFPFKFGISFNRAKYRIKFGGEVETSKGLKSGTLSFSDAWGSNLRLGMRIVNHTEGINSQLVVDNVKLVEADQF
ncbi:MAG: hypothetical protein JW808_03615 [Victivallales bacterium]|nr:hypothetical protein [Victivallales bacterium]